MLTTKRVIDLTPEEADRCRELTYGDEGWMLEDFEAAIQRESVGRHYRYTQVILYVDDGGLTRKKGIIGWCLLQPVPNSSRYVSFFFVDPGYRGRGIGTRLIQEASKWGKFKLDVQVDYTNWGFFKNFPQLHEGNI